MKPKFNKSYFMREIHNCFKPYEFKQRNILLTIVDLQIGDNEYITKDEMFKRLQLAI